MGERDCFAGIATPEQAAWVLVKFYGRGAKLAAVRAAQAARCDDRMGDYKFWRDVLSALYEAERAPRSLH